jgi:hypothetical protein
MARYKYIDTQPRLLAVDLSRQLLPGTFEHALNHLLDHAIDLSHFDARFQNDATGAPAYLSTPTRIAHFHQQELRTLGGG